MGSEMCIRDRGGCDDLMMLQRQDALDGLLSEGLSDESGTEDRE